jgi:hypothetical protein
VGTGADDGGHRADQAPEPVDVRWIAGDVDVMVRPGDDEGR